ncbi:MAG: ATP-grasp domain-containing protein [Spirochaetia bacterium]
MARVLVTGVGGPAGRTVAAMLLERGHFVAGVDAREVPAPGIDFQRVPLAGNPDFLGELRSAADRAKADLLIPTVTEELTIIAEQWSLVSAVPVMIGPAPAVKAANDKYLTCLRLSEAGASVPRFCLPSQVRSPQEVEKVLGWPCLSKPRTGRGGRGVVVRYPEDWPAIAALDDLSILQEFLPGTDYAPNLCVPRASGAAVVAVILEKTRLKEGIVGNAAEVRRAEAPDVMALACGAARAMGFVGPLDVDVRRGKDGRPAVLEINARFGANIAFAPEVLDAALADWGFGG